MKYIFFIPLLFLFSCNNNDLTTEVTPKGDYQDGYFILNKGTANNSGTLDYITTDLSSLTENAYNLVNGEPLNNEPVSSVTYGNSIYILGQGTHKIVKANRYTLVNMMLRTTELDGNNISPRYMTIFNGIGYLTAWTVKDSAVIAKVFVINLNTLETITSIQVSAAPDQIFGYHGKIYALLKGGVTDSGTDQSNKIAVIDPQTNTLEKELTVGYRPNGFMGYNENIMISCGGHQTNFVNDQDGSLWLLDEEGNISKTYDWADVTPGTYEDLGGIGITYNNIIYFLLDKKIYTVNKGENPLTASAINDNNYQSINLVENNAFAFPTSQTSGQKGTVDLYSGKKFQKSFTTGVNPQFAGQ